MKLKASGPDVHLLGIPSSSIPFDAIARSLMESGTELAGIVTKSSLQAGIAFALGKQLRGRT